jgi:hypothetical protein
MIHAKLYHIVWLSLSSAIKVNLVRQSPYRCSLWRSNKQVTPLFTPLFFGEVSQFRESSLALTGILRNSSNSRTLREQQDLPLLREINKVNETGVNRKN